VWDENTIRIRLYNLSEARKDTWIHSNLAVSDSNWASRCLWWLVGKRFDCLRNLYFINPAASARSLSRLGVVIAEQSDPKLRNLFFNAASNFTLITNHVVEYPDWNSYQNRPAIAVVSSEPEEVPAVPLMVNSEPIFMPTAEPVPFAINEPASPVIHQVEPVVVHKYHPLSPTPVVIVDHGIRPRPYVGSPIAPCYVAPYRAPRVVTRVPASTVAGHEIPGAGRGETVRNIAPALAARNVHLISRPTVAFGRPAAVPPRAVERMAPVRTFVPPQMPVRQAVVRNSGAPASFSVTNLAGRVAAGGRR
jgi:hypothetical protein